MTPICRLLAVLASPWSLFRSFPHYLTWPLHFPLLDLNPTLTFDACYDATLILTNPELDPEWPWLARCLIEQVAVSLRPSEAVLIWRDLEDGRKYSDGDVGFDPDRGSIRKHPVHDQHERQNEDHRPVYARPQVQTPKHRIQTKRRDLEGQTTCFYLNENYCRVDPKMLTSIRYRR